MNFFDEILVLLSLGFTFTLPLCQSTTTNGIQELSFIDDFCYSELENPLLDTPKKGTKRKMGAPVIPFSEASPKPQNPV